MFRTTYDQDVTIFDPNGRVYQVEYAMEAVKQGSCAVAAKSDTHVVMATLKRSQHQLSSYQQKVFKIDDNIGLSMSGITADGRILCRYMRNQCLNHRHIFSTAMPVSRIVRALADKAQVCTQRASKRPYGVGLLVAGYDSTGSRLFYNCPSGIFNEYYAHAIGSRSQASRTYLERCVDQLATSTLEELVQHSLKALKASLQEGKLTVDNTSLAIVGEDMPFTLLEGERIKDYIDLLQQDDGDDEDAAQTAGGDAPTEMET